MKLVELVSLILYTLIFTTGVIGILTITHEAYHYFTINGEPTGICFGVCDLGETYNNITNDTRAIGAISWEFTPSQYKELNLIKEERNAWLFSATFTLIIVALFLYSNNKINKYS